MAADTRPNDLLPTAELPAPDDYLLLDGESQGTRQMLANTLRSTASLTHNMGVAGSVDRTVSNKLSEFPSVLDYGRTGRDDAERFNKAIADHLNRRGSTPGTIIVPWGVYTFQTPVVMADRVHFLGFKHRFYGAIIRPSAPDITCFTTAKHVFTQDMELEGLHFYLEHPSSVAPISAAVIDWSGSSNSRINKCDFTHINGTAIKLDGNGSFLDIFYCNFERCNVALDVKDWTGIQCSHTRFIRDYANTPVGCEMRIRKLATEIGNLNLGARNGYSFLNCHLEEAKIISNGNMVRFEGGPFFKVRVELGPFSSNNVLRPASWIGGNEPILDFGWQNEIYGAVASSTGYAPIKKSLVRNDRPIHGDGRIAVETDTNDVFVQQAIAGGTDGGFSSGVAQLYSEADSTSFGDSAAVSLFDTSGAVMFKKPCNLFTFSKSYRPRATGTWITQTTISGGTVQAIAQTNKLLNGTLRNPTNDAIDTTWWEDNSLPFEGITLRESGAPALTRLNNTIGSGVLVQTVSGTQGKHYKIFVTYKPVGGVMLFRVGFTDIRNPAGDTFLEVPLTAAAGINLEADAESGGVGLHGQTLWVHSLRNSLRMGFFTTTLAAVDVQYVALLECE